jgi:hypothetical protein
MPAEQNLANIPSTTTKIKQPPKSSNPQKREVSEQGKYKKHQRELNPQVFDMRDSKQNRV